MQEIESDQTELTAALEPALEPALETAPETAPGPWPGTAPETAPDPPVPKAEPVFGYVTIKQAAELRPAFSAAAFRDIKFKANDRKNSRGDVIKGNGTGPAGVWIQIGAKVLIDLDAFDRWIESHKTTIVPSTKPPPALLKPPDKVKDIKSSSTKPRPALFKASQSSACNSERATDAASADERKTHHENPL